MITVGVQPKDGGSSPLFRSNLSRPSSEGFLLPIKKGVSKDPLKCGELTSLLFLYFLCEDVVHTEDAVVLVAFRSSKTV
jgi:hypothetical protein